MPEPFWFPVAVRYYECDQQGVVFNMWYLGWFDEAFTAFLSHVGRPYPQMVAEGTDAQLARTEIDYRAPVRYGDAVRVGVEFAHLGTTSFTLAFSLLRRGTGDVDEVEAVIGRTIYVAVATDGSGKKVHGFRAV